jgi:DNA-binding PadR family transcriptional regulator
MRWPRRRTPEATDETAPCECLICRIRHAVFGPPMTRAEIEQAMAELEAEGLAERTGELQRGRDGRWYPVYGLTEKGERAARQLEDDE